MKKFIYAAVLLALVSCAAKKVNFQELQDRNGLYFLANDAKPFTGEVISYLNGKTEFEGEVKDGLREGLWIFYYPSGQKKSEGLYTDGLKEGIWNSWKENGEQEPAEVYKMGQRLGNEPSAADSATADSVASAPAEAKTAPASAPEKKQAPKPEPKKPVAVEWERLHGGPVKLLDGHPYTGPVIKHFSNGVVELEGNFTNGKRSGKWTFYTKAGNVKDIKYY